MSLQRRRREALVAASLWRACDKFGGELVQRRWGVATSLYQ
jgi:hypothetical protein